ncbi:MAG: hypothetical protein IK152_04425 [Lachnospiraceae bacterium]|nr:hypothetical protein [Lachnospiraceae bacterium]
MLTLICLLITFGLVGSLLKVAFKMTWGVTRIVFGIILLPLFIVGFILSGIFFLAIPALVVLGILALVGMLSRPA